MFILYNQGSLEKMLDVLKWGNNGVFKEQAGDDRVVETCCSPLPSSSGVKQNSRKGLLILCGGLPEFISF